MVRLRREGRRGSQHRRREVGDSKSLATRPQTLQLARTVFACTNITLDSNGKSTVAVPYRSDGRAELSNAQDRCQVVPNSNNVLLLPGRIQSQN